MGKKTSLNSLSPKSGRWPARFPQRYYRQQGRYYRQLCVEALTSWRYYRWPWRYHRSVPLEVPLVPTEAQKRRYPERYRGR